MGLFRQHLTDEDLLGRTAAGDTGAFDELYRRYSSRLLHYFARMLGEEKAQDFLQELFLKLIQNATSFAAESRFSTWIFAVAHNMCCNEYRYQAVRRDTVVADVDRIAVEVLLDADSRLDTAAFKHALRAELDGLDQDRRSTFLLRFQEGFALAEIARIMNCPVGTVKSRLFHTTRLLADRLRAFHPCPDEENQYE